MNSPNAMTAKNTAGRASRKKASGKSTRRFSVEERSQMIATAAYFRAEARGFDGGDPVADWLAAEAEIENLQH